MGGSVRRLLARSSKLQEMRLHPQSHGQADRRPDQTRLGPHTRRTSLSLPPSGVHGFFPPFQQESLPQHAQPSLVTEVAFLMQI